MRILTGIQSSGRPHLGNILGAILPAVELSKKSGNESFLFIADLHTLTSLKDGATIRANTLSIAAAWLACGLDTQHTYFYRQSKLAPYHTELLWYLSCVTPFPMLANAHSFKDKSNKLADVNAGLFTYPVLQAADILLYDANLIPVGKDQRQHIEMTRDMAEGINRLNILRQLKEQTNNAPNSLLESLNLLDSKIKSHNYVFLNNDIFINPLEYINLFKDYYKQIELKHRNNAIDYSNNNTTTFNFNLKYAAKIVIEINSNIQKIKNSIKNKDIDSISNSLIIKTIGLIEDTGIILQTYKSFIDNYPIFGSKHTNHGTDINNYDLLNQNEFLLNTIIENSIFVIPEAEISEHVMTIPGIDGQKMSKSLNNYIDIFSDEKDLLKQIKKIVTDATPLEDPKNPDEDITFKLYQLIASPEEVAQMRANYLQGGYGYGHAKQALYEAMLAYFKDAREKFDYYMANPKEIEAKLEEGEARVKPIAEATIQRVREIFQF